jgi:undecaprenyl diphosphate synthase
VAIVMDGNGRWATARGLPRLAGHRRGAEAVRRTVTRAAERGIEMLTLYAFSVQNWSRPATEVRGLMRLLRTYLHGETPKLLREGVRLRMAGDRRGLPAEVLEAFGMAEAATAHCRRLTLNIAVNYGGQEELIHAARELVQMAAEGRLAAGDVDAACLEERLYLAGAPPVDLFLRTAGERRVSNFLLYQSAYAELVFLEVLWPDFAADHLDAALDEYSTRRRTFGGLAGH